MRTSGCAQNSPSRTPIPYSAESAAEKCELFQPSTTKESTPTRAASAPNRLSTLTWGISARPAVSRSIRYRSRASSASKPASVSARQAAATA